MSQATEERTLAQRCCGGDRAAQRELFDREVRRVHATLYRILGADLELDDLVQEAFIEVFRSLPGFRGDAALSTWIDRIVVRTAFARIGQRKPRTARLSVVPEPQDGAALADQRVMQRQAAKRFYALLEQLEPRQRVAYTLHVVDNRSLREVAEAMGASFAITKARVWRASRWVAARARKDPLLATFIVGENRT